MGCAKVALHYRTALAGGEAKNAAHDRSELGHTRCRTAATAIADVAVAAVGGPTAVTDGRLHAAQLPTAQLEEDVRARALRGAASSRKDCLRTDRSAVGPQTSRRERA